MTDMLADAGKEILRETETSVMWCTMDIMYVKVKEGASIYARHANGDMNSDWRSRFTRPFGLLVDVRGIKYIEREAREAYAKHQSMDSKARAVALVIDSMLSRIIANFFIGFNKADRPIRIFNGVEEAEIWLRERI